MCTAAELARGFALAEPQAMQKASSRIAAENGSQKKWLADLN
ncbi:MAG TPA: hypothetical protein VH042_07370 [Solirubrobacterales bacterium]|nr:hypothetical protein [Solirubrobacterales bacterium]